MVPADLIRTCDVDVYAEIDRAECVALQATAQDLRVRQRTVEHPFGTLKSWMGGTHFLTKTLQRVSTEMALHVLAYNPEPSDKPDGVWRNAPRIAGMNLF